jgi:hypothetical protein
MARQRPQRALGAGDSRRSGRGQHGMRRVELDALLASQDGRCAICGTRDPDQGWGQGWATDHDHALAATHAHPPQRGCRLCVRGILCGACNAGIGQLRDDSRIVAAALSYLRAWEARHA